LPRSEGAGLGSWLCARRIWNRSLVARAEPLVLTSRKLTHSLPEPCRAAAVMYLSRLGARYRADSNERPRRLRSASV